MDALCEQFGIEFITYNDELYAPYIQLQEKVLYEKFIPTGYRSDIMKRRRITEIGNVDYMSESNLIKYLADMHWHPEHYNARKYLGTEPDDLVKCFNKKQEIETLAPICERFRKQYQIIYQFKFGTYYLDLVIFVNDNAAVFIEIDENGHRQRDPEYEQARDDIVRSRMMEMVRLEPGKHKIEDMIGMVKNKLEKLTYLITKDITIEQLQNELKDESIDKDFYETIGRGLISRNKFSVNFDDVWKYLEYSRKDHAKKKLLNEKFFTEYCDYTIKWGGNFAPECAGAKFDNRGGHNHEIILLTKFAMYTFCMVAGTKKANECRAKIITVYTKYQDLLLKTREIMIDERNRIEADRKVNIEQVKADEALKEKLRSKDREIELIREELTEMTDIKNKAVSNFENIKINFEAYQARHEGYFKANTELHEKYDDLKDSYKEMKKLYEDLKERHSEKISQLAEANKKIEELMNKPKGIIPAGIINQYAAAHDEFMKFLRAGGGLENEPSVKSNANPEILTAKVIYRAETINVNNNIIVDGEELDIDALMAGLGF